MKALQELLKSKLGKVAAAVLLLALVFRAALHFTGAPVWPYLDPILLAFLLTAVLWVALDLGYQAWQKKRQASFDAKLAAREGIEERRREWIEWTAELERQGIDRYQLPMYLLLGEPDSGKSVMLRNSDLHFPFGQSRLSGVAGTRGCDWWFTDQAVILDLAGRLFTHEGGASDEAEWAAFLELLAAFRPQCPANGVILVLPCDGLASDEEGVISRKAAKMQSALTTLTDKLQARLPVYVVLTKADRVFGFAECVHRLDAPKRHEMFGWSRSLERLEAPFDMAESRRGFEGLVERARLLRSQMLATARIPEALPEVDRLYAFPEELAALWPNVASYLERVFTESRLIDKLFFRGLYLTSGLQSGAPIARVCAELMGQSGEADRRSLDSLFTKQRAYFIKDLVRERIFTEQGLVRPTRQRVVRARRNARLAYAGAGVGAVLSLFWTSRVMAKEASDETRLAVHDVTRSIDEARLKDDPYALMDAMRPLGDVTASIGLAHYGTLQGHLEDLGARALDWMAPRLAGDAARIFATSTPEPTSFDEFEQQLGVAATLLGSRLDDEGWQRLLAFLPEAEDRALSPITAGAASPLDLPAAERDAVLERAVELWEGTLEAGSGWARPSRFGFWLACQGLVGPGDQIRRLNRTDGCVVTRRYTHGLDLLRESARFVEGERTALASRVVLEDLEELAEGRAEFLENARAAPREWPRIGELAQQVSVAETYRVPKPVLALLGDATLAEICRPSFLALDLASLPGDVARPTPTEALAAEVFQARFDCASDDYVRTFADVTKLRERLSIRAREARYSPELSEHLGGMQAALGGFPGSAWLHHVEGLVDEYEVALLQGWSAEPHGFEAELEQHLDRVGLAVATRGREAWLRGVAGLLTTRMGTSVREAASAFDRLVDRPGVGEFAKPLRNVAGELARDEQLQPAVISGKLVGARTSAKEPPRSGAGAFAELCFRALCERVLELSIRPAFRLELEERIGPDGSARHLVEAIWGQGGDFDLAFFDRGGALDLLREKYHVAPLAQPVAASSPPSPAPPRDWMLAEFRGAPADPSWAALGFLLELQAFLLAGDQEGKHASGAKTEVTVKCDPTSSVCKQKGSIYVHAGQDWAHDFTGDRIKPLSRSWTFGSVKEFRVRWSEQDPIRPEDLSVLESGPFAPLRLAWRGTRTSANDWSFLEVLPNSELEARLTFVFDRPLPERPLARPFAGE